MIAKMETNTVRVYDFASKTVTTIHADELAPGMTKVRINELGDVWVRPEDVQPRSEPVHDFDDSIVPYIESIKLALDEVYPQSLDEWIDGFQRDGNPEREIAVWLHIGKKYQAATRGKNLAEQAKQDYFSIFLACCNSGREHALLTLKLRELSRAEAEAAVRFFFESTGGQAD